MRGNTAVLPNLVIDDTAQDATINAVSLGFPSTTIAGVAEPNAGIRVIGLLSVTPEILQGASTGEVVDSLPAGVESASIGEGTAGVDGSFTVTVPGFASQVVYIQVVDLAGNRSRLTTVVLGHALTRQAPVSYTHLTLPTN